MRTSRIIGLAILALVLSFNLALLAEEKAALAGPAQVIAPFLDAQTLAVLRIDTARIDVDAILVKVCAVGQIKPEDDLYKEFAAAKATAAQWLADFKTAGGGEVYGIVSPPDFPRFILLAPVKPGADGEKIKALLKQAVPFAASPGSPTYLDTFEQRGSLVVGGTQATLDRLKASPPVARPEFAQAFVVTEDSAAQLILAPSDDSRRVFEEMMPMLPPQLGGEPMTSLTRGGKWLALSLNGPPTIKLNLTIQSPDAASAQNLAQTTGTILKTAGQQADAREALPNLDRALALLTPTAKGERVVLNLDEKSCNTLLTDLVTPALTQARQAAGATVCASQLKQLGLAVINYACDNQDSYPPDLEALAKKQDVATKILACPVSHTPYIYRGADLTGKQVKSEMVLAYDKAGNHPGGLRNVLFADGHVQPRMTETQFQDAIKLDNELRRKAGLPERAAE
jgi:prepilin-type processing-associated H-X9-DG protein